MNSPIDIAELELRLANTESTLSATVAKLAKTERLARLRLLTSGFAVVLSLIVFTAPRASAQFAPPIYGPIQTQINNLAQALAAEVTRATAAENALSTSIGNETSRALTAESTLTASTTALQTKTQYMSVSGTNTIFSGTNVSIVNGLGFTSLVNGLGNLTIGYSENYFNNNRAGSHNLVLGEENAYASYGSIVGGYQNYTNQPYTFVVGSENEALGFASSVTGGNFNYATGDSSSVTGGIYGYATGGISTVGGGNGTVESRTAGWSAGSLHN